MEYRQLEVKDIGPDLVGRKVFRGGTASTGAVDLADHIGEVVGWDEQEAVVWVSWQLGRSPKRHRYNDLMLVSEREKLTKSLKFRGKKFGDLEEFIAQAKREGATAGTELNPTDERWVAILVELPLATVDPGGMELSADGVVIKNVPEPKHNHDFNLVDCGPGCPVFKFPTRPVRDNPQA